jgi:hypothetical protein
LACYPEYIKRLFVSEKFALKGLYTLKFYKNGRWRYVHIDDRMPCRQSGTVNFCRNGNPNETFAMLIEKAYAKLHGCYEAIAVGLVEKVLYDLTPAAGVDALNISTFPLESVCDSVWEYLELAIAEKRCIGCLRFVPDPQGENPTTKQGISTGRLDFTTTYKVFIMVEKYRLHVSDRRYLYSECRTHRGPRCFDNRDDLREESTSK